MSANRYRWPHRLAAVAASAVLAAPVHASGPKLAAPVHDDWSRECGSCHIAYPPRLLPAASWQAIMQGLDRHFGSDATIDASAASSIGAFLQANAGRDRGASVPPVLRITETRWFVHEHAKVPARTWNSASVRNAANCGACHEGAAAGRFSEHDVRLPRP
jgi:nitrate/TMAO reductase-like tetraheme cytochrome c subunit